MVFEERPAKVVHTALAEGTRSFLGKFPGPKRQRVSTLKNVPRCAAAAFGDDTSHARLIIDVLCRRLRVAPSEQSYANLHNGDYDRLFLLLPHW